MNLRKQKQLAGRALGVSTKRIKFDPKSTEDIKSLKDMLSREDARSLVDDKIIKKLNKRGNSRTSANKIMVQKKKGRRSGQGSRKGTANARFKSKDKWIIKIRALRANLVVLKEEEQLDKKTYRDLYRKAKGNFFRNKRHMNLYIEQNNLLNEAKKVEEKK